MLWRGIAVCAALAVGLSWTVATQEKPAIPPSWGLPNIDMLPNDDHGRLVRFGKALVERTYALMGPNVSDPTKRYAGHQRSPTFAHQ